MIDRLRQFFRRKFVRDTLILQIGKVGVLALGLLSSVIIPVLMGPSTYGTWQLGLSLYGIWQTLNLTGLIPSAQTRLAAAVGAEDDDELLNIMAFFIRTTLLYSAVSTGLLWLLRPVLATQFYAGDVTIVTLALLLTLTQPTELIYHLLIITFSSRRQMRHVALLQNINQLVLVGAAVLAVSLSPTPTALVVSRLAYSLLTLGLVAVVYERTRAHSDMTYPALATVLVFLPRARGTAYWRFGFTNALDKNVANLYGYLPVQMAGAIVGKEAAGYVGLALNIIRQQTFFTSALLDNMQAIVPQAIGRGDYARLWQNFNRVLLSLTLGGVAFYAVFAVASPYVVTLLYDVTWLPAVPLLQALTVYGVVTTVGGIFGPLYRAFDFVRGAFLIKLAALIVLYPLGRWMMQGMGALGAVWMLNLLHMLSVGLTVALTLPELRQRAKYATN